MAASLPRAGPGFLAPAVGAPAPRVRRHAHSGGKVPALSGRPTVVLVGGGVSAFLAGIELRDRLPDARLVLVTADREDRLGGHLASWDEDGYPVEHGLHALFGFYETLLPTLERIGAMGNFTRSREWTFVAERGALHRFSPSTWPLTYRGFRAREKLALARLLPAIGPTLLRPAQPDLEAVRALDHLDLRALARERGVPESVVRSNFVRQLYDAPFNEPGELSATVAVQGLARIFARPWHYYFNGPSRECLVEPLHRHFTDRCGGEVRFDARVRALAWDAAGARVTGVELVDGARIDADAVVVAVGVEEFKQLDLGARWAAHPTFAAVHRLRTVSSVSLQAWFRDDPVPPGIDSLVCGLAEPTSIFAPLSRVRSGAAPRRALPYELMWCGPEAGFEDVPDRTLAERAFRELNGYGFRIPIDRMDDPAVCHWVLRRNRAPAHRYLYTPPGELMLRPPAETPVDNLFLAGAWIRNPTALPCVEAAAESARAAAEGVARELTRGPMAAFRGMPRVGPLVLPPPYEFRDVVGWLLLVDADEAGIAAYLPPGLRVLPGFEARALVGVFDHREVCAPADPTRSVFGYHEVVVAALVYDEARGPVGGAGVLPLVLYLDDDTAVAAGREVYGYPKKLAQVDVSDTGMRVVRAGRPPGVTEEGRPAPIELLAAEWEVAETGGVVLDVLVRALSALGARLPGEGPPVEVTFYNVLELPPPRGDERAPAFAQLTRMPVTDLRVRSARALQVEALRVGRSATDPVHLLAPDGAFAVRAAGRLEASFTMKDAEGQPAGRSTTLPHA